MTDSAICHDVVIVGAGAVGICTGTALLEAGVTDFVILEKADGIGASWPSTLRGHLRSGGEIISSVFDDDTDTWTVTTDDGALCRGRAVIAARGSLQIPWIPNLAGRSDFRGASVHSAAWDANCDPAGKRIALIGGDATSGQFMGRLVASAASVTVFGLPPRRIVSTLAGGRARGQPWLRRYFPSAAQQRPSPELVRSPIDTVTASGIRTCDGVDHAVDAIIYGTGYAIPASVPSLVGAGGLRIQQAWHDGMEPYLGVAVHGFPNYFLVSGPDAEAQVGYIVECLVLMKRASSTRIEVRRSSQQVFNERVHLRRPPRHPVPSAFDLSPGARVQDETYAGPATLTIAGTCQEVRVQLTGHVDPIDGKYHWQGTIFDTLSAELLKQTRTVTLAAGGRSVSARITEQTPQDTHSVAGVGAPPFTLDDVELAVPQL